MAAAVSPVSPLMDAEGVTFVLMDRHRRLRAVRLVQEVGLSGPMALSRSADEWRLRLPLPAVDRMEYRYEIEDERDNRSTIIDPANPQRAGGAFGDRSEVRFPRYQVPEWLSAPACPHTVSPLEWPPGPSGIKLTGLLWHPVALPAGQRAPLLVVHDGPEYAALGAFTGYLGAAVAAGMLPPVRAALLGPGDRDAWYSANPSYARALRGAVLGLERVAPSTVRIGVGVSLGGLAMLHAHRSHPELFDALLLQSGSFFTPTLDPQERHFSGFGPVTAFVAGVHAAPADERPVPAVLTCGLAEENLANNRRMTATLRRLGYPARLVERRDAHNYTAWRDALHPPFTHMVIDLLADRAA